MRFTRGCIVQHDDGFDLWQRVTNTQNLFKLPAGVDQNKLSVRMIDDVLALFGGTRRIQTDADTTSGNRTNVADRPLGYVAHQNADRPALFQTQRKQRRGEVVSFSIKTIPRNTLPSFVAAKIEDVARLCGLAIGPYAIDE